MGEKMNWYKLAKDQEAQAAYDYGEAPQEELQEMARMWESAMQEDVVPAKEFNWTYYEAFPLERFIGIGNLSAEEWVNHFNDEQTWAAEDGREGYYDDMILKPIEEPIVAVELGDKMELWDGYHRIGASFAKGAKTIRAIIGTRK